MLVKSKTLSITLPPDNPRVLCTKRGIGLLAIHLLDLLIQTNTNSLLFLTQNDFPWICPSVIYNQKFSTPAILNYVSFPLQRVQNTCFNWNGTLY